MVSPCTRRCLSLRQVFAELLGELRQALVRPELLGKLVVQFRLNLFLDALHFKIVGHALARQLPFAKVGGIAHLEL